MSDVHLTNHILIVGAGVIGLTVAWELARQGHDVFVLDRAEPGFGATRVAGGMLGLTAEAEFGERDLLELERKSLRMYPDFVAQLKEDSQIDPRYRTEPTVVVARDRDDIEALQRVFDYQRKQDLPARWIDTEEVRDLVPQIRSGQRAVLCSSDHFVDTDLLTEALAAACRARGVTICADAPVASILTGKGRARGVQLQDGRRFFAHRTVVCAGAWTSTIEGIPEFERPVMRPVRGQIVTLESRRGLELNHVVRSPDVYLVPRAEGRIAIGSTMEEKGFDDEVTAGAVRTLLDEAWQILPAIDDCAVTDLQCGFRPISLDGRPMLGASRLDGLHLATGHGRHGILLAPLSGRIMARHLDSPRAAQRAYRPFDPRRFFP